MGCPSWQIDLNLCQWTSKNGETATNHIKSPHVLLVQENSEISRKGIFFSSTLVWKLSIQESNGLKLLKCSPSISSKCTRIAIFRTNPPSQILCAKPKSIVAHILISLHAIKYLQRKWFVYTPPLITHGWRLNPSKAWSFSVQSSLNVGSIIVFPYSNCFFTTVSICDFSDLEHSHFSS